MALKCAHKGCGKTFIDENEECIYHPGPPVFHEGQKGWKCCKPRVLTFDEFLSIPPCTTGTHTTVDDGAPPSAKPSEDAMHHAPLPKVPNGVTGPSAACHNATEEPLREAVSESGKSTYDAPLAPAAPESDSDGSSTPIPPKAACKRRGCSAVADEPGSNAVTRQGNECTYHPGQAIFHEGSKGWTCCKKRVLEFDEFMRIPGCKKRPRHCFVGKRRANRSDVGGHGEWEKLDEVRHDFYQTPSQVHASLYLKNIDKNNSSIRFAEDGLKVSLNLRTSDWKIHEADLPLFGRIDPEKSTFKIMGTKLELTLAKADGIGWSVLRADDRPTGEIIQTGRAGRA
ncbi:MAG: hypothetical protein M1831_005931 [Alyxoria varia]|nr:MAG: hypothetical protein M1831_005931 [Alyxoria varia]